MVQFYEDNFIYLDLSETLYVKFFFKRREI